MQVANEQIHIELESLTRCILEKQTSDSRCRHILNVKPDTFAAEFMKLGLPDSHGGGGYELKIANIVVMTLLLTGGAVVSGVIPPNVQTWNTTRRSRSHRSAS